jgi:hypothetical protein
MLIGTLRVEFRLHGIFSKKAKRSVAASYKQKLRNKFNVSVAEIEDQELLSSLVLGIVTVSNDAKYVSSVMNKIIGQLEGMNSEEIVDVSTEIFGA